MPNTELMIETLAFISTHMGQWDQEVWLHQEPQPPTLTSESEVYADEVIPGGFDCETSGCLAGWACLLGGAMPIYRRYDDGAPFWFRRGLLMPSGLRQRDIGDAAVVLLEIGSSVADVPEHEHDGEDGDDPCELSWDLFSASNDWDDLIRIAAAHLDLNPANLEAQVDARAEQLGASSGVPA